MPGMASLTYEELKTEYKRVDAVLKGVGSGDRTVYVPPNAFEYPGWRDELKMGIVSYEAGHRFASNDNRFDAAAHAPYNLERFSEGVTAARNGVQLNAPMMDIGTTPVEMIDREAGAGRAKAEAILEYDKRSPLEQKHLDNALDSKQRLLESQGIMIGSVAWVGAALEIRGAEQAVMGLRPTLDATHGEIARGLINTAGDGPGTSYYRGEAAVFNSVVESLNTKHPQLGRDLPIPIEIDMRQRAEIVQERSRGASINV